MKAYAQIEFSDGTIRAFNLKARGIDDADNKVLRVSNWLEKPGSRELVRWTIFYRRYRASIPFLPIPYRGKLNKGHIFFTDWLRQDQLTRENSDNG